MSEAVVSGKSDSPASHAAFPLLVFLFVGSGCAALIYEVVWFQLLGFVIGASSVSLGVLLGTFMGGMCLGSYLLPRVVSPKHHPLLVYAVLELGIGVIGVLVLFGMPLVGGVYTAWAGSGTIGFLLRGIAAAIILLPPTILMGATLPAVSRWVKTTPNGVSWLGFFYGGNIGGAVLGSLLAGFYLLRVYDVTIATLAALGLNVAVAMVGFAAAKVTHYEPATEDAQGGASETGAWPIYVTIGLSGMTALAAEVIWTRHLSLLFGATVYTFSLILAVFLLGLGIGSTGGSALARSLKRPRLVLGWCQLGLCLGIAWTAYMVTESLPFWPIDLTIAAEPWINFQLDFVRALWAVLPPAILWGASFPLALAAAATRGQDPGRLVGGLYAANTIGAIVGSLGASLILVISVGSHHAQQVLIVFSAISGVLMWLPIGSEASFPRTRSASAAMGLALGCAGLLVISVPPVPEKFIAFGRFLPIWGQLPEVIYVGEGLTGSVAVTREPDGILNYHNAGKVQASSYPADMRLQRMLGHLTTLVPENRNSFLVIGCGAGVTAGAVSINPEVQNVVIAEIEPLVPEVVSRYFGEQNYRVVDNPKVDIHIDDGRHFLLTTDQKFDGITSDPLDPWVKGAAALYTREFWQLARDHLNPGGVVTVFVQLYESTEEAVKSEIATFLQVFPNGAVFANTVEGSGYDVVLLGQAEDRRIDIDLIQARLTSPAYRDVAESLREVGFYSAVDLLGTFAGQVSDLGPWLEDASINRDSNLRLQYLAGMGLNLYEADVIFNNMVSSGVQFPENLFTGSAGAMQALAGEVQVRQGR
jgi:spermidine synthase